MSPAAAALPLRTPWDPPPPSVPPASTVAPRFPALRLRPAPLPRARKPRPLRSRGSRPTAPASLPRAGFRMRSPPSGRGPYVSRQAVRAAARAGREGFAPQPAERSRTTFPRAVQASASGWPREATADSASRRAAQGQRAAGEGRADAGGPDVRLRRPALRRAARVLPPPGRGRAARGLARRRPPWR